MSSQDTMGLLILLFPLIVLSAKGEDKILEKITRTFNKCREEHPISEGELEMMKKRNIESGFSDSAKCLMACMLKEGKILNGGSYAVDNAITMSDVLHKDNAEQAAKARQVIETCSTLYPEVGPDPCKFAYDLAVCGAKEATKLGMNTPDFLA